MLDDYRRRRVSLLAEDRADQGTAAHDHQKATPDRTLPACAGRLIEKERVIATLETTMSTAGREAEARLMRHDHRDTSSSEGSIITNLHNTLMMVAIVRMVVFATVVRQVTVSIELEPGAARRYEVARRPMRDVPQHNVRGLNALIVPIDGWHAARRSRRAPLGATPCAPGLDIAVLQRPDFAVVALSCTNQRSPVRRLVDDLPVEVGARVVRGL